MLPFWIFFTPSAGFVDELLILDGIGMMKAFESLDWIGTGLDLGVGAVIANLGILGCRDFGAGKVGWIKGLSRCLCCLICRFPLFLLAFARCSGLFSSDEVLWNYTVPYSFLELKVLGFSKLLVVFSGSKCSQLWFSHW